MDYSNLINELTKLSKELFHSGSNYELIVSTDIDRVVSHLRNLEKIKNG